MLAIGWGVCDALWDEARMFGERAGASFDQRFATQEVRLAANQLRAIRAMLDRLDAALPAEAYVAVRLNPKATATALQRQLTIHRTLRQLLYPRVLHVVAAAEPRPPARRPLREF